MRFKHVHIERFMEGEIPAPGQIFSIRPSTVYIAVDIRGIDGVVCDPYILRNNIAGVSLETGRLHILPIKSSNRFGFTIHEPANGLWN